MSQLEIIYTLALLAAALFTGVAVPILFLVSFIRFFLKERRKHAAQRQAFQTGESQGGPITTWEFEKRREDVLSRIKERPLLSVPYQLTTADYLRFHRHHNWRLSASYLRTRLITWLGCLILAAALGLYGHVLGNWNPSLVRVVFGVALVWFFLYPPLVCFAEWSNVQRAARNRRLQGIVGVRHLIFTADSFIEIGIAATTEIPWRNIYRVDDAGDYTFVYITPISAFILPKEGFPYPEDYERAKAIIKECSSSRIQQAQQEPAPRSTDAITQLPSGPSNIRL